jgi:integrase
MPKIAKPLSDLQVRRITRVGWHAVGGVAGLLLQVRNPAKEGAQIPRSWILRVKVGDQRQPIGLGSYPIIGKILVSDIVMRDVRNVLEQEAVVDKDTKGKLWNVKTETAKRLLGRIKTILDYATVNEYRSGTNPAQWTGHLSTQLPSPKKLQKKGHHPAVPYPQMWDFMSKLRSNPSISAKALEFLILTAVRSGSVRQAQWSEIDFDKALWIIPAEHTKARQEHRVRYNFKQSICLNHYPSWRVQTSSSQAQKVNLLATWHLAS